MILKKFFFITTGFNYKFIVLNFFILINFKTKELSYDSLYSEADIEYMIFHSNIIFWAGMGMYNLIRLNVWCKENSETYNLKNYIITMLTLALAIFIIELALYLILWKNT